MLRYSVIRSLTNVVLSDMSWKRFVSIRHLQPWTQLAVKNVLTCHQCKLLHISFITSKRRKTAEEKKAPRIIQYSPKAKVVKIVDIWKSMTVSDLADALGKDTGHVFDVMIFVDNSESYNEPKAVIDNWQVIQDVVIKSGMKFRLVAPPGSKKTVERDRDVCKRPSADPTLLIKRSPVVTVMGHVDHGKTTLLDSLRNTSVVDTEFGGITQHIGAFLVKLKTGDIITFMDTPGHAAFTAMRARGAEATDIIVLVVAADDGVMEQTVESIRMAKEANVPIIVAINKIDKPEADIGRTKRMLVQYGIQVEDEGGDVQVIEISALHATNLDLLAEAIVLQAELMDLKGDPNGMVEGIVIESRKDIHRGKLSSALIQRGTLRKGAVLVAGTAWAKVRAMFDEVGQPVHEAPPATPVEIVGWRELPSAGDEMVEVESERHAHDVVRWRESRKLMKKQEADKETVMAKAEEHLKTYRAQLEKKRLMGTFKSRPTGPRQKQFKEDDDLGPKVSVIIKGDVDGSVEAILDVLETYNSNSQCRLNLIHYGIGNVTESDLKLAQAFNAIIYMFNVEASKTIQQTAKGNKIVIRYHNIIYKLIEDLKKEISLCLPPKEVEEELGEANILQQFEINDGKKIVFVAGCRCTKGILKRSAYYRLFRGRDVIHEGTLKSMRHLKNDVDNVKKNVECGLQLLDVNVTFQSGDVLSCYELKSEAQETDWDPGF